MFLLFKRQEGDTQTQEARVSPSESPSCIHPHNQGLTPGLRPAARKLNAGEISVSSSPISTNCPVLEFSPPRSQEAEGPFEISKGKHPLGTSMGLLALLWSRESGIAVLPLKASSFPSLSLISFFKIGVI